MTKGRNPINFPQGTSQDLFTCPKTTLSPGVLADVFIGSSYFLFIFSFYGTV
jgi:hypothetical protein